MIEFDCSWSWPMWPNTHTSVDLFSNHDFASKLDVVAAHYMSGSSLDMVDHTSIRAVCYGLLGPDTFRSICSHLWFNCVLMMDSHTHTHTHLTRMQWIKAINFLVHCGSCAVTLISPNKITFEEWKDARFLFTADRDARFYGIVVRFKKHA